MYQQQYFKLQKMLIFTDRPKLSKHHYFPLRAGFQIGKYWPLYISGSLILNYCLVSLFFYSFNWDPVTVNMCFGYRYLVLTSLVTFPSALH